MGNPNGIISNTLVSAGFRSINGIIDSRYVLPHSTIKIVINFHCGPDINNDPIIKSFIYYYDNTRGRMRYYPFIACNNTSADPSEYDVIFVPEILYPSDLYYNTFSQEILPDGTLDYFPFSEIVLPSSNCNSTVNLPNQATDVYAPENLLNYYLNTYSNSSSMANAMYLDIQNNSTNIFPSPYSLRSCPLRNSYGNYFVGYDSQTNFIQPGIRQSYFIDQNTDLNIINPTEKVIYNPSEATITANNFIFPQGYTFKTIRGVYPSGNDALAARIPENGCNSSTDLRDVPVVTDLTSENPDDAANFPLSTQALTKHLYASRYYMENNSKITIQNCVRLFDCTFDVKQGATLLFDDYPTHLGKEDHSYDRQDCRFKIQTLGGAVLRNYADIQYLQNGNITQTYPLHYKAVSKIYAGNDVDLDSDVPKQDYVVNSGANVTLQANDVIYLEPGFHALSGSIFHAIASSPGTSIAPCTPSAFSQRMAATTQKESKPLPEFKISVYPNPTNGILKFHNDFLPFIAQQLTIEDAFGRVVYSRSKYNSMESIDFSSQPDGMYVALISSNGIASAVKFIVQH